jgi:hypothetical protein
MFNLSIEELEEIFKEDNESDNNQIEIKNEMQTPQEDEEYTYSENYGSSSLKIVGFDSYRYNKSVIINTDLKEYNEYKTLKKIKQTLRSILTNTNIECNKTEDIINKTAELFKKQKRVTRNKNRLALLALCYYKTTNINHSAFKASLLVPLFNCNRRDLSTFIRSSDWNISGNEYDFLIKYGHILNLSEHIDKATKILNVCINKVKLLIGPSSSKISTMSGAVWFYIIKNVLFLNTYTRATLAQAIDIGKSSLSNYYGYILTNESKILELTNLL